MKYFNPYIQKTKLLKINNKGLAILMQNPNAFTQQIKRPVRAYFIALKDIQIFL